MKRKRFEKFEKRKKQKKINKEEEEIRAQFFYSICLDFSKDKFVNKLLKEFLKKWACQSKNTG